MNKFIRRIIQLNFLVLPVAVIFSILSDVHVVADSSVGSWLFNLYTTFFIFGLVVLYFFVILNKGTIKPISNDIKNGMFFIMLLGYGFLLAFAIFGSLPKLLHGFSSSEGTTELTVEGKSNIRTRGECSPHIEVKEVTFFLDNHICVSDSVFDELMVGGKVTVYGKVSKYGLEVNHIR
jgi:Na+-translocating ferredoxin:NAD+ oxidoreductase RnfE subunit